jgi:hypothetical protein
MEDKRDTLWTMEKDQNKFWEPPILAKFTTTSRWSRVPHDQRGSGPDVVCYEVDNTKQVKKYSTMAACAGCKKTPYQPTTTRRAANSPRSKLQQEMKAFHRPPLDFSFLRLQNTMEHLSAAAEELVPGFIGVVQPGDSATASDAWAADGAPDSSALGVGAPRPPAPPVGSTADAEGGIKGRRTVGPSASRKRGRKPGATSIRLNNNELMSITGTAVTLDSVINCERMSWIDLSYNSLAQVESELSNFPNLIVLNLHCNDLNKFSDVAKLKRFRKLRTLTLFGNPLEQRASYRWRVISMLPQLKKLDSRVITPKERDRASQFERKLKRAIAPAKPTKKV